MLCETNSSGRERVQIKKIARAPKDELRGDMKTSGDLPVCGRYALNIILRAKFP